MTHVGRYAYTGNMLRAHLPPRLHGEKSQSFIYRCYRCKATFWPVSSHLKTYVFSCGPEVRSVATWRALNTISSAPSCRDLNIATDRG